MSAASFFTKHSGLVAYPASGKKQNQLVKSLVQNVIVKCGLPVSLVDNVHFRSFLADLDPCFLPPCRQTVTYSIIPQLLAAKQKEVADLLQSVADAALTVDIWTDRRAHSFIGITV